jgi:hypothetical protein
MRQLLKTNLKRRMINITPDNDLKEHEESPHCHCLPRIKYENGEMIVIHNSYDLREVIEEVNEILNPSEDGQED